MVSISGATSSVKGVGKLNLDTTTSNYKLTDVTKNVNQNAIDGQYEIDYTNFTYDEYGNIVSYANSYVSHNIAPVPSQAIKIGTKVPKSNLKVDDNILVNVDEEKKDSFGKWELEHDDYRLKVFNDNRIAYNNSHGKVIGSNQVDHFIAAIMPYGSKEESKYALRAYKQTALNKRGNFYAQHGEDDVKSFKTTTTTTKDGKEITQVEEIKNDVYKQYYASKYSYNNDKYEQYKQMYKDIGFDRNPAKNVYTSLKSDAMFMHDYMRDTGGFKGMAQEVRGNMGEGSFKEGFVNLVKEGRNANSVRGDKSYIVGYNTKYANFNVYRKGLWSAKDIEHDTVYGKNDKQYKKDLKVVSDNLDKSYENREVMFDSYGRSSGYWGYVDVGEGTAEATLFKQRAEGGFVTSSGYTDMRTDGYEEFNFLQAKATANIEYGIDHINLSATASVCVASVEAGASTEFETRIGDCKLHLGSAHIRGDARALEADVKAFATAGLYKGEDGKTHLDAGIRLEANAELCSAGVSGGTDFLGIGTSASARVKIGAGAQFNVGFQDGEFKFKIGLAVGVGFEVGGSIDISGAIDNLTELWEHADFKKAGEIVLGELEKAGEWVENFVLDGAKSVVCDLIDKLPSPSDIANDAVVFITSSAKTIANWVPFL